MRPGADLVPHHSRARRSAAMCASTAIHAATLSDTLSERPPPTGIAESGSPGAGDFATAGRHRPPYGVELNWQGWVGCGARARLLSWAAV